MRILKQNEGTVDQLCTAACIRRFSLHTWLGRLKDIEKYIERVQLFHNLLDRHVQGMWYQGLKLSRRKAAIRHASSVDGEMKVLLFYRNNNF